MLVSGPADDPAGSGASRHIRKDPEHKTAVGALGAKLTAGKSGVGEPEMGQRHSPGKPLRLARHLIPKPQRRQLRGASRTKDPAGRGPGKRPAQFPGCKQVLRPAPERIRARSVFTFSVKHRHDPQDLLSRESPHVTHAQSFHLRPGDKETFWRAHRRPDMISTTLIALVSLISFGSVA